MKTYNFLLFKAAFFVVFLLFSTTVFSQIKNTWRGGTPGMETDWDCPKNWSNYKVPDEFSDVYIPDVTTTSLSPPTILNGKYEIQSLFLESNAHLKIMENSMLVVFGEAEGILKDNIELNGSLVILDEAARAKSNDTVAQEN